MAVVVSDALSVPDVFVKHVLFATTGAPTAAAEATTDTVIPPNRVASVAVARLVIAAVDVPTLRYAEIV